ncbi:hypothetical protein NQ315_014089 [Exocentrus adspersus]|uniref:PiggyBac transposable element-derived protein domain-containing protein n=1 Tax=Exocentrus adspersus TaxID=1586481 RepID=A0AAV8VVM4_9CUCU|nr:hypothetical protein NQ315_014089 [Exocentrus adspersus]
MILYETESDVDVHLEQGDSESEEDSDEDDAGNSLYFVSFHVAPGAEIPEASNLPDQDADSGPVHVSADTPNWQEAPTDPKNFPFSKNNELLVPIPGNNEPVDYFHMIFDDDILKLMENETNQYAEEIFCSEGTTEKSRVTRCKSVTCDKMLKFIALVLHTGAIKMNRLQDYWKIHPLYNMKYFSAFMSHDRFLLILRRLHFARNPGHGENSTDRLHKIRPVLNFFNNKMAQLYYPGKELSLDESMVLWRGRLVFRQYIKKQAPQNKYGIKLYMLTEPSGIIIKSQVYTGALHDGGGKGHTTRVVWWNITRCDI